MLIAGQSFYLYAYMKLFDYKTCTHIDDHKATIGLDNYFVKAI